MLLVNLELVSITLTVDRPRTAVYSVHNCRPWAGFSNDICTSFALIIHINCYFIYFLLVNEVFVGFQFDIFSIDLNAFIL